MTTNSKEYNKRVYEKYWGNKKAIRDRVARNKARSIMIKKWKVSKWDWKEVDHINWIKWWNWNWNIRVISQLKNRVLWQKKAMKDRVSKYNIIKK